MSKIRNRTSGYRLWFVNAWNKLERISLHVFLERNFIVRLRRNVENRLRVLLLTLWIFRSRKYLGIPFELNLWWPDVINVMILDCISFLIVGKLYIWIDYLCNPVSGVPVGFYFWITPMQVFCIWWSILYFWDILNSPKRYTTIFMFDFYT